MELQPLVVPPADGGMNVALDPHAIPENQARYLQDARCEPGLVVRRGPVDEVASGPTFTRKGFGLAQTFDPAGSWRLAALTADGSNGYFQIFSSAFSELGAFADSDLPNSLSPYPTFHTSPALHGGAFIGASNQFGLGATKQYLGYWRGGTKPVYSTGTLTVARGGTSVTGSGTSWTANASPGMFLFATADDPASTTVYIGVVKSVDSDTAITLEAKALFAATAKAYELRPLRGLNPKVSTGRITTSTTSTTVNGGNTAFTDQGMNSGTWTLYRASDLTYIGKVSSVASNIQLTLTANAAIALEDEDYLGVKATGDWNDSTVGIDRKVGPITAIYANRQWYFGLSRVPDAKGDYTLFGYFSDLNDPEAIDLLNDRIAISSTEGLNSAVVAAVPAYNSLLVLKEREAFAITGQTRGQFAVRKLEGDGCLGGVTTYKEGVIWAGKQGIWYYDGVDTNSLTEKNLGKEYREALDDFDPSTYRIWGMVIRDHYICHIERVSPNIGVVKGASTTTPTRWTVCIRLDDSEATSLWTNVNLRGHVHPPQLTGLPTLYLVNSSSRAYLCNGSQLWAESGVDDFAADGGTAGPDFYFESRRFDGGDGTIKKLWKKLYAVYISAGGALSLDTITALGTTGTASSETFAAKTAFDDGARVTFIKRSRYFGFRLYQSTTAITSIKLAEMHLLVKGMRQQRVR